jgi:hypothetical protein
VDILKSRNEELEAKIELLKNEIKDLEKDTAFDNSNDITDDKAGVPGFSDGKSEKNEYLCIIGEVYDSIGGWKDILFGPKAEFVKRALYEFLKEETHNIDDIKKELPFITIAVSDDGLLRIYSWYQKEGGTYLAYHSIIQYRLESGRYGVEFFSANYSNEESDRFNYPEVEYHSIINLKKHVYLINGHTRSSSSVYANVFIVLELNKTLNPYNVFDNDNVLEIIQSLKRDRANVYSSAGYFTEKPYKIKIAYDASEEIELVFNGEEFTGDYDKLHEIINTR